MCYPETSPTVHGVVSALLAKAQIDAAEANREMRRELGVSTRSEGELIA